MKFFSRMDSRTINKSSVYASSELPKILSKYKTLTSFSHKCLRYGKNKYFCSPKEMYPSY